MLWLRCRLAAVALIWFLVWELPYAAAVALKRQKKKKKKKKKEKKKNVNSTESYISSLVMEHDGR